MQKAQRNHKAFVKWVFSTKLHKPQNTYRVISIDRPTQTYSSSIHSHFNFLNLYISFCEEYFSESYSKIPSSNTVNNWV